MKKFISLFAFALSAFGGWGQMESDDYRFTIQESRRMLSNPILQMNLPLPPVIKPLVSVFVFPKDGTPTAKEHRVTIRFVGSDGKTYRQSLTAIPLQVGFAAMFDVDALDVLSVDIERVNPPVIKETQ